MRVTLLVAFSLLAGAAAAQAPKAAAPEEPSAAPAPRLNLKLDNPSQYIRESPPERAGGGDGLPSLGEDARRLPAPPLTVPAPTSSSASSRPYPPDTQRGER